MEKSFLMKTNSNNQIEFVDAKDRASFLRLLSIFKANGKNATIHLSVKDSSGVGKLVSTKQINLFHVLVNMISSQTGQDKETVYNTLLERYFEPNFEVVELKEKSSIDFSEFFEWCISFTADFFNINVYYNQQTNTLECGDTF